MTARDLIALLAPRIVTCDVCGKPLDDSRPWQPGLDGGGAHVECLKTTEEDDDG